LTKEEHQLCKDHFPALLKLVCLNGHVPDQEFLDRGFSPDTNCAGEEAPRLAGVSQEHCQQAKILSHEQQVKVWAELMDEKMATKQKKQEEANAGVDRTLAGNISCKKKIMDTLVAEWVPTPMAKDGLTLKHTVERHFFACIIPDLNPFLKARGVKTFTKKADLAKAAYEAREKALTLEAAPDIVVTEDEEPMQPVVLNAPMTNHSESSIFVASFEFICVVQEVFDPKDLHLRQDVDIEMLNKDIDVHYAGWDSTH
jgi:hypothetical protein